MSLVGQTDECLTIDKALLYDRVDDFQAVFNEHFKKVSNRSIKLPKKEAWVVLIFFY